MGGGGVNDFCRRIFHQLHGFLRRLVRQAQKHQVRGVYQPYAPEAFQGKRLLLIDDIVTTGSTLSECCRVLLTAGAQSVVCAALATPRKNPEQKGEPS